MRDLFFCFGPPKSGTTFLQRMLDSHPQVSCPSEQHLDFLQDGLAKLFTEYNRAVAITDRRTGGQGAFQCTELILEKVFFDCVNRIAISAAGSKKYCGLSDNSILPNFHICRRTFPRAKFIAIFRHPIPRAVSAWNHNIRIAKEESCPMHSELLANSGGYENWVRMMAHDFNNAVQSYRDWLEDDQRCMHVTYETLLADRRELVRIFDFLGVETSRNEISTIYRRNAFETQRSISPAPHFFRAASTSFRDESLSDAVIDEVNEIAAESLDFLGYPCGSPTVSRN